MGASSFGEMVSGVPAHCVSRPGCPLRRDFTQVTFAWPLWAHLKNDHITVPNLGVVGSGPPWAGAGCGGSGSG